MELLGDPAVALGRVQGVFQVSRHTKSRLPQSPNVLHEGLVIIVLHNHY